MNFENITTLNEEENRRTNEFVMNFLNNREWIREEIAREEAKAEPDMDKVQCLSMDITNPRDHFNSEADGVLTFIEQDAAWQILTTENN